MKRLPREAHVDRVVEILGRSPLFEGLTDANLRKLAQFPAVVQWEPGEVLLKEGEIADTFLILLAGNATVDVVPKPGAPPVQVARLQGGDLVGEMALLLDQPRTATVSAESAVVAVEFQAAVFFKLFQQIPAFGPAVCRFLAKRVAAVSHKVPVPDATDAKGPEAAAAEMLPLPFIQRHLVLPLKLEGDVLTLGVVLDPDAHLVDAVRRQVPGMRVRPVRIPRTMVDEYLKAHAGDGGPRAAAQAAPAAGAAPGVPLDLDRTLRRMVAEGASDLHLSAGTRPRWRIDGDVRELAEAAPLAEDDVNRMFQKILTPEQAEELSRKGELDFAYSLAGAGRFRVNVYRQVRGTSAAMRLIPEKVPPLEGLGLPPVLANLADLHNGLVLVTGATGSGKSTTLAAIVDRIRRTRRCHILTLEDPVEFVHAPDLALVSQREVRTHTRSFADALRAALREDPDVVLVGEMRDLETTALAIETANTGHLVLATLHTRTAIGTIERIVGQFPADQQAQIRTTLADVLKAVVCQVLAPRRGGGRVAAAEVLVSSPAVANLIREGKAHQIQTMMSTGQAQGNVLLNQSLERLVAGNVIDPVEAIRLSADRAEMARRLGVVDAPAGVDAAGARVSPASGEAGRAPSRR
jgi:twitching motility protein PilT